MIPDDNIRSPRISPELQALIDENDSIVEELEGLAMRINGIGQSPKYLREERLKQYTLQHSEKLSKHKELVKQIEALIPSNPSV